MLIKETEGKGKRERKQLMMRETEKREGTREGGATGLAS